MLIKQTSPPLLRNLAQVTFGQLMIVFSTRLNLLYLLLPLLNWIGALTLFLLLKLPRRKLEFLSMKFLSRGLALYLYKSTIQTFMEYSCHAWADSPSCNLDMLDKLYNRVCRTIGPSLAVSLEPVAHCQYITSLSLFYRYYFGRCSFELTELVPLPYSRWSSTRYANRLHNFFVAISRYYKDVYVSSFISLTTRPWSSLPAEYFPLTYDLNGCKVYS